MADFKSQGLHPQVQLFRGAFSGAELVSGLNIIQYSQPSPIGKRLSKKLYLLPSQFQLLEDHARDVAARVRQGGHISQCKRIEIDSYHDDRDETARSNYRLE